jgi:hypothetical protein
MVELFLDEESVEVQIFLGLIKIQILSKCQHLILTIILNSTLLTLLFVTIFLYII